MLVCHELWTRWRAIFLAGGMSVLLRRLVVGVFIVHSIADVCFSAGAPGKRIASPATGMELLLVRGGTFAMGSPVDEPERERNEAQHTVVLTQSYYLGTCEVTQKAFETIMGYNPSTKRGDAQLPVETITWFDAILFCNRVSELERLEQAYKIVVTSTEGRHVTFADVERKMSSTGYRLPTEAEWEFACRAGTTSPFSFGNTVTTSNANFDGQTPYRGSEKGPFTRQTLPVHALPPNAWGFYQMSGNVFEWVADYYGEYSLEKQTDPTGPKKGKNRVRRGGSYYSPGGHMRSAVRHSIPPEAILFHMGFRVARSCSADVDRNAK